MIAFVDAQTIAALGLGFAAHQVDACNYVAPLVGTTNLYITAILLM